MTSSRLAQKQNLPVLLPAEKIKARVNELAREIRRDYQEQDLTFLVVLRGAFVFAADLVRAMGIPVSIEFICAQSYNDSTHTSGNVRILYAPTTLSGRNILIVEDIVDTGLTLDVIKKWLEDAGAASIKICALLDKPARREVEIELDYVGFVIPDVFVVGYGIDYAGHHRELTDIHYIKE